MVFYLTLSAKQIVQHPLNVACLLTCFFYITELSSCQLTWNNFKKVATRLVLIGRHLIDLTTLKRNTTLPEKGRKV